MKTDNESLLSAYGDGWYDGFLCAQKIAEKVQEDNYEILYIDKDTVALMSEDAEEKSQIGKIKELV